VIWIDHHMEPQCAPDPRYPAGIDLDISGGARETCVTLLDYPARRCGVYLIQCRICGASFAVTTAGRVDDPRSVKLACQMPETLQ
jgi:hypothetical protein